MYYELARSSWGPEEIEAIEEIVKKGFFTMGENVRTFEEQFARKFGARYAVMVNSGSSANLVGIAALFFKKERP
ncbi:MAG: DegT/DnrJ/EryC1/StrS family aminotransferase, partial [Leptospirales bacterium]